MPRGLAPLRLSRALCLLLAGLAWTPRAAALETPSAAPERVRLVYARGADCPTPAALERELDIRLGTGWQAQPDELARTIAVTEELAREDHAVRIEYSDGSGRAVTRAINARTCEEAASMTAVVVAVAIDALAHERETAKSAPALHGSVVPPAVPPAPAPVPSAAALTPKPHATRFVHEAGLRFSVTTGFGTGAAWGAGAEWGLVARSFAVRAALEARTTGSVPAADAHARFSAFTGRSDVCAPTLRPPGRLSGRLCAGLEVGALRAEGVLSPPAVTAAQPSTVPWIAGLVTPRLRLATTHVFVELVSELRFPFTRHTFTLEAPERRVFAIPAVAFGVSLGAGVRFN